MQSNSTIPLVIIAGGTGSVGEGLVKQFLERGWQVVVPGRNRAKLQSLQAYCDNNSRLSVHEADLSDPNSSEMFFKECHKLYDHADLLIASLGGWRQGIPLTSLSWEDWQATIEENLNSHFLTMRYGYALLNRNGHYIHINGMGAESVIPTAGPTVAAAAAQGKLALTLAAENPEGPKVYELVLGLVKTRARERVSSNEKMVTPEKIADFIIALANLLTKNIHQIVYKLTDDITLQRELDRILLSGRN